MTARTLVLVRHAKAESVSLSGDRGRRLTGAGLDQARRLGRALAALVPKISVAVTSPAVRAHQTLDALGEAIQIGSQVEDDGLYLCGAGDLVDLARTMTTPSVMIVGHEPSISAAGAALAATVQERDRVALGIPTATAVILRFEGEWADLDEGSCSLDLIREPTRQP